VKRASLYSANSAKDTSILNFSLSSEILKFSSNLSLKVSAHVFGQAIVFY